MKFTIDNQQDNILNLMRHIGYAPYYDSFVKRLGSNKFPRFHIYIKDNEFDLHLDQKKPSYAGQKAHSGEYSNKIIEEEKKRIINLLNT